MLLPHVGPRRAARAAASRRSRRARRAPRRRARADRLAGGAARARFAEDLRDSRGCLLEAGGQVDDALDGRHAPGAARGRLLDRADDAAGGRCASGPTRRSSGSTRTATSTRPRRPRAASSAACAWPARAGCGTRASASALVDPARVVLAACATSTRRERELLERSEATVIGASRSRRSCAENALDGAPVYVHLDLDVLDPTDHARRSSRRRAASSASKLHDLLEAVAEACELVGVEVTASRRRTTTPSARDADDASPTRPRAAARRDPGRSPMPRLSADRSPPSILRPLVEDLHERREKAQARRRRGEDRAPARAGEADRARAARPADRRGHVRRARHPRAAALLPARAGGQGRAGRRRRSPATARSTAGWSRSAPTTSPSWRGRWG